MDVPVDEPVSSAWTRWERFALLQLLRVLGEGICSSPAPGNSRTKAALGGGWSSSSVPGSQPPSPSARFVSVGFGFEKGV